VNPPKSFALLGRTIRVVTKPIEGDAVAQWDARQDLITIIPGLPPDLRYTSFLHECVHAWLDQLGREDLSKDETFVDTLAGLVHQMLVTSAK
jgi:Zn-dependent peptidase ImmA (M78 family)